MPKNASDKSSQNNKIIQITEADFKDKIYTIRGQKVMLDYDLAKIYGYTTSALNQQVKRNIEKFEEDFMFRLTEKEMKTLYDDTVTSISQNVTSIQVKGIKGGRSKLIYAFTEQGIYMLMTVLKGELAVRQSKVLIRLFKKMKDYIIETNNTLAYRDNLQLAIQVSKKYYR